MSDVNFALALELDAGFFFNSERNSSASCCVTIFFLTKRSSSAPASCACKIDIVFKADATAIPQMKFFVRMRRGGLATIVMKDAREMQHGLQ